MSVKKRKPTNQVRREEAEALKQQINTLEYQIHVLKEATMTPSDHLQLLRRSRRTKTMLKELVLEHELYIAGVQSKLMHFQENRHTTPLYTYINLPQAPAERKQLLENMKKDKLNNTMGYLVACSRHLDLMNKHNSELRYTDLQGSYCSERFEVIQILDVKSMEKVYEAAKFFLTNVEISTSEALGHITVREDYDTVGDDESINHFRLISTRPSGVVTESNKVLYDKFYNQHELIQGHPCAVMVTDSVDEDDLHPYDPNSRVRLDVSAALVMTEEKRRRSQGSRPECETMKPEVTGIAETQVKEVPVDTPSREEEEDELVTVVIRCAVFMKVRLPELDVPSDALNTLGDGGASWIKVMLKM